MLLRPLLLATSVLTACASSPYYAVFPPAEPGQEAQRVHRATFSIVPPAGWATPEDPSSDSLRAQEDPPPHGQYRLFRILTVDPIAAATGDEPETLVANALDSLRARHATDDLDIHEKGTVRLCDRDCPYFVGRMRGPAEGWWFQVLEYYVPGADGSLAVSFLVPDGQLALSRKAMEATASTLRTTSPPPTAIEGEVRWLDDHHFGLRLPGNWEAIDDLQGALAVYLQKDGGAQCDVVAETSQTGYDLDRLRQSYASDRAAELPGFTMIDTQQRRVGGRPAVRFLASYRDGDRTIVVDDTFVTQGNKLYRVQFRMPKDELPAIRRTLDQAVGSVRIE